MLFPQEFFFQLTVRYRRRLDNYSRLATAKLLTPIVELVDMFQITPVELEIHFSAAFTLLVMPMESSPWCWRASWYLFLTSEKDHLVFTFLDHLDPKLALAGAIHRGRSTVLLYEVTLVR